MSEMVERVARALVTVTEQNGGPPWEYWEAQSGGKHVLSGYRDQARAAIAAMRDGIDMADLTQFLADNMDADGAQSIGYWEDVAKSAVIGIFHDEPVDGGEKRA